MIYYYINTEKKIRTEKRRLILTFARYITEK